MQAAPQISIVTIVWNDRDGMERTFRSVQDQSFQDYEYIVIDGASTDGTTAFLKDHQDQIDDDAAFRHAQCRL